MNEDLKRFRISRLIDVQIVLSCIINSWKLINRKWKGSDEIMIFLFRFNPLKKIYYTSNKN